RSQASPSRVAYQTGSSCNNAGRLPAARQPRSQGLLAEHRATAAVRVTVVARPGSRHHANVGAAALPPLKLDRSTQPELIGARGKPKHTWGTMTVEHLPAVDAGSLITADLCLIGSGPAAWTIAEELRNSGLQVLILESGGQPQPLRTRARPGALYAFPREKSIHVHVDTDGLNEIQSIGVPIYNWRDRVLGGTSHSWGGRCIPLDDIDYEAREWVPFSGWPFGSSVIAPYLNRASEYLGVTPCWRDRCDASPVSISKRANFDPALLRTVWWEENPNPVRFGPLFLACRNPNLRVLLHATVTQLNMDASGHHLESVEVTTPQGKSTTVQARAVVLCAGGSRTRVSCCIPTV